MMQESHGRHNLTMSGIGTASGGVYADVNVQGIAKIHGDIDCFNFRIEGVVRHTGDIKAKQVEIQGKSKSEGNVVAEVIRLEGKSTINGNCDAETFQVSGAVTVDGLLNAGDIEIRLYGPVYVKEMGGETIRVVHAQRRGFLGRFRKLTADLIEGDDIYLENTTAKIVRGNHVKIGPDCVIGLVEYRTTFSSEEGSKVTNHKKL